MPANSPPTFFLSRIFYLPIFFLLPIFIQAIKAVCAMHADKHTILNLLIDNSRMGEFDDMYDFGTVRSLLTLSNIAAAITIIINLIKEVSVLLLPTSDSLFFFFIYFCCSWCLKLTNGRWWGACASNLCGPQRLEISCVAPHGWSWKTALSSYALGPPQRCCSLIRRVTCEAAYE
jgi:hypothetical protein